MKKLKLIQFKTAILSKNLLIIFLDFFALNWEDDLYSQLYAMWVFAKKKRYKTFRIFLLYKFLDNKRSPIITLRLCRIFYRLLEDKLEMQALEKYCIANNLFENILKKRKENINLVILIISFNILFYNILPFSHIKFLKLKKKRNYYIFLLLDYIQLSNSQKKKLYPDLYKDLDNFKRHIISNIYKQSIQQTNKKLNSIFYNCILLFPPIPPTFNREILPSSYIDKDYEYYDEMYYQLKDLYESQKRKADEED